MMRQRRISRKVIFGLILTVTALIALFPFVYMGLVSFTQKKFLDFNFIGESFSFDNYLNIFRNLSIGRNILNSAIVSAGACLLNNIISSMAAYGFTKLKWRGRDKIFTIYMATLMVPAQVTLVPAFIIMRSMGLLNSYIALMLPVINAFGIFLIKQFMADVPDNLLEAGRIDGAGDFRVFVQIVLPLIKPVIVSLTIFTFITTWNDFLWPLVISTNENMQTLTVAISSLKGNYSTNYGLVMAGTMIAFLPAFILFAILQKQFVEGIAFSGIKG